jgi:hypothetical protein
MMFHRLREKKVQVSGGFGQYKRASSRLSLFATLYLSRFSQKWYTDLTHVQFLATTKRFGFCRVFLQYGRSGGLEKIRSSIVAATTIVIVVLARVAVVVSGSVLKANNKPFAPKEQSTGSYPFCSRCMTKSSLWYICQRTAMENRRSLQRLVGKNGRRCRCWTCRRRCRWTR